jgi:hypothetical protein
MKENGTTFALYFAQGDSERTDKGLFGVEKPNGIPHKFAFFR